MDKQKTLPALSAQVSLACMLCTVTCLVTLIERGTVPGRYYPLVLLPYAPILYGLNRLLLRSSRTMRTLVIWNAAVSLALFIPVIPIDGWQGLTYTVFALLFFLSVTAQGVQLCLEPPVLSQMILRLDVSLLLLVLYLGYTAAVEVDPLWTLPIVIGCVSAAVGVISCRVGGRLGVRGRVVMAAAFAVIVGLAWLVVRFLAAPAGGGLVALWQAALSALKALGNLITRFLVFLASLLPQPQGTLELETQNDLPPLCTAGTAFELPPGVLPAIVAALIIGIILFFVLRKLGRIRVGGKTDGTVKAGPTRQRMNLLAGLQKMLAAWKQALGLRLWLWHNRDTPAGLFFLLDRRCRSGPWRRSPGETPREFLCRLGSTAQGDPALCAALSELVIAVDAALYAPATARPVSPASGASLIRRRIGRAVRRQRLQQCLAALKRRFSRA